MVIKRKSPCDHQGKKSSSAMSSEWDDAAIREAVAAAAADAATATVFGVPKNPGKRYVGVRQRPSGRWVAEIKDTIQKIRVWLGTYDSAEAAARAYDEAACILRGPNTRTNFWPRSPSDYPAPPALPPKIYSLLLRRKAKASPAKQSTNMAPTSTTIDFSATSTEYHQKKKLQQPQQLYVNADFESIEEFKFADFLNDQNFFTTTAAAAAASPSCSSGNDSYLSQFMEGSSAQLEERSQGVSYEEENERSGPVDLQLVDDMERLPGLFLPFDIAEEIDVGSLETEEESCLFGAAMKRMKYERRISACLYALNGVSECLRFRRGGVGDHLKELSNSCKKKQNMFEMEEQVGVETGRNVKLENQQIDSPSSSSSCSSSISSLSNDAELSLWSSLDLSPICWFT